MIFRSRKLANFCHRLFFGVIIVSCGCGTPFVKTPIDPRSQQPSVSCDQALVPTTRARHFDHVLIIVLENQNYRDVISHPYFASLAQKGVNFTDSHGLFHPSYSNYLAMVAGREIPSFYDIQRDLPYETIADRLHARRLTWKNYAEGYPTELTKDPERCFTESTAGSLYARKHVPFLSFSWVQQHECDKIVPSSQFEKDLDNNDLPSYAFYSPDLEHDGHNPPLSPQEGLAQAAVFLAAFLEPRRDGRHFPKNTLIVVTFDESYGQSYAEGNHIYTVFLGEMVKPGWYDGNYTHYNVLRTIEENFGLCPLADGDGKAKPIMGVWQEVRPKGEAAVPPASPQPCAKVH